MVGSVSGELLSYRGRVLVHDNPHELEFLFPGTRVVTLPSFVTPELTMPITQHPEMASVRWPLDRKDFR